MQFQLIWKKVFGFFRFRFIYHNFMCESFFLCMEKKRFPLIKSTTEKNKKGKKFCPKKIALTFLLESLIVSHLLVYVYFTAKKSTKDFGFETVFRKNKDQNYTMLQHLHCISLITLWTRSNLHRIHLRHLSAIMITVPFLYHFRFVSTLV